MYHKAQVKKQGDVYYKLKTDLKWGIFKATCGQFLWPGAL